jgi:hypothetical protein
MNRMARWCAGSGASRKPGSSWAAVRGGGKVRLASTLGMTCGVQRCGESLLTHCPVADHDLLPASFRQLLEFSGMEMHSSHSASVM